MRNNGFGIDFSLKSPALREQVELLKARKNTANKRWNKKKKEIKESRKKTPQRGFF